MSLSLVATSHLGVRYQPATGYGYSAFLDQPAKPAKTVKRGPLTEYLERLQEAGEISAALAQTARGFWNRLSAAAPDLPVPDAAPGPEGQVLYAWNKDQHHLELEIFPNQPAEWFYYDRATEETWEEEDTRNALLSPQVKDKLRHFHQNA